MMCDFTVNSLKKLRSVNKVIGYDTNVKKNIIIKQYRERGTTQPMTTPKTFNSQTMKQPVGLGLRKEKKII